MKRKPKRALSFFQFALLRQHIVPGAESQPNLAGRILDAEDALQSAGWTREQAKAEIRKNPNSREAQS